MDGAHVVEAAPARGPAEPRAFVASVVIRGAARTREATLLELLPRLPPATYSERELAEFERRVNNLAIFDDVELTRERQRLVLRVREKWTLIPSVEFSSGATLEDSYALAGVTEFNFLGTGNQLGLAVTHEQRGWGVSAGFVEHPYRRHRWALGAEVGYSTAGYRFDDGSSWRMESAYLSLGFNSPPWLDDHLSYHAGAWAVSDTVSEVVGEASPSGVGVGMLMTFNWDAYHWHDLVPRGYSLNLTLGVGFMAEPEPKPRDSAELVLIAAQPLWDSAVFSLRNATSVVTRGNANAAELLGSVDGVRGLEDAFYRNWLQSFANLELRQAVRLGERWAAQGVAFTDGALLEQMTAEGERGASGSAFSLGFGARLIPTWLAGVLLRVDVARLIVPEQRWFVQVGLGQYF